MVGHDVVARKVESRPRAACSRSRLGHLFLEYQDLNIQDQYLRIFLDTTLAKLPVHRELQLLEILRNGELGTALRRVTSGSYQRVRLLRFRIRLKSIVPGKDNSRKRGSSLQFSYDGFEPFVEDGFVSFHVSHDSFSERTASDVNQWLVVKVFRFYLIFDKPRRYPVSRSVIVVTFHAPTCCLDVSEDFFIERRDAEKVVEKFLGGVHLNMHYMSW